MSHFLKTRILTHKQKVCSLYKRASRDIEAWQTDRAEIELRRAHLRHEFEQNRDVKDLMAATKILNDAEYKLFYQKHPQPKQFTHSPGGICYERELTPPDWVLDFWHPIEKAAYPDYFAKREVRKKEFIKLWENNFGRKV